VQLTVAMPVWWFCLCLQEDSGVMGHASEVLISIRSVDGRLLGGWRSACFSGCVAGGDPPLDTAALFGRDALAPLWMPHVAADGQECPGYGHCRHTSCGGRVIGELALADDYGVVTGDRYVRSNWLHGA
jgi:hypothetical protein